MNRPLECERLETRCCPSMICPSLTGLPQHHAGDIFSMDSNQNHITESGLGDDVVIQGSFNSAWIAGSLNVILIGTPILKATQDQAMVQGNGNHVFIYGNNDHVLVVGSNNFIAVNGNNKNIVIVGNYQHQNL